MSLHVTISEHQPSVTGDGTHKRLDEDPSLSSHKDSNIDPEDNAQRKGQLNSDDSDDTARGTEPHDLPGDTDNQTAVDPTATPSPPHQNLSEGQVDSASSPPHQNLSEGQVDSASSPPHQNLSEGQVDSASSPPHQNLSEGQVDSASSPPHQNLSEGQVDSASSPPHQNLSEGQVDSASSPPHQNLPEGQVDSASSPPHQNLSEGQVDSASPSLHQNLSEGQVDSASPSPHQNLSEGQVDSASSPPHQNLSEGQVDSASPSPHQNLSEGQIDSARKSQVAENRKEEDRLPGSDCPPSRKTTLLHLNYQKKHEKNQALWQSSLLLKAQTAVDTNSSGKANTQLAPVQQGGGDCSKSPSPSLSPASQSDAEWSHLVAANVTEIHQQTRPLQADLGEGRFLVQGSLEIPEIPAHGIPYKYAVYKPHKDYYKGRYEVIYQKDSDQYINRCLFIKEELVTPEGEWHQYDDMIHPELKTAYFWESLETVVNRRRGRAGAEMLRTIFDVPTTWNEKNVENFFFLLRQFYHTYSCPLVHDGRARHSGLPYGETEVKDLLKDFLEKESKTPTLNFPNRLHAGIIALLVYNEYLNESIRGHLSNLCDYLCLPKKPQHHFCDFWKTFTSALTDQKGVADAVEKLCSHARRENIHKWVLVLPLIHLLRGDIQPFEPVPPVLNPQFVSWAGYNSKATQGHRTYNERSLINIMKDHAHLVDIDRLLVYSWMSLLSLDDVMSFITNVRVDLLDILHHLQFSLRSRNTYNYEALKRIVSHLIEKENYQKPSYDDKYGERCLKTAATVLRSICCLTTDPNHRALPLKVLELICLITDAYDCANSQSRERIYEEALGDTLQTMREWRGKTFTNRLLDQWDGSKFASPKEIEVWNKLISLSFNHKDLTSSWRTTFIKDFERKLKKEKPIDQIRIYCGKMEDLSKTRPLLCDSMEKCALEAVAAICQDKSRRDVFSLLENRDISKFGKLMSVIVLKSWPIDANGDHIKEEESVIEHILNWPMSKTIFEMRGSSVDNVQPPGVDRQTRERGRLMDNLTDDSELMTLASSTFKSVTKKFLNGDIEIKTLKQILENHHVLCADGRCKDEEEIKTLLQLRKQEVEAVNRDKELVKGLLQICQELPKHVKADFKGLDDKIRHQIEMMTLDTFIEVHRLDGQTSAGLVKYFDLDDNTREMASKLRAIKESSVFKMCWTNQVEELSREQPDTEETEHLEEVYSLDQINSEIFQSCYEEYTRIYDGLKSGTLSLEEVDSIFTDYRGIKDDMKKELEIMCRINPSDNRNWIGRRINQIQQYYDLDLAVESARIIMGVSETMCPNGDFKALQKLRDMSEADFKNNSLNYIDDNLMETKEILMDITADRRECLEALSLSHNFVPWLKGALKDINELKVFVDLASISAGENDLDVDRVAYFHDAVLGYSSILYGLEPNSDFKAFKDALTKLWKALENDKNIPKKLRDTERNLQWLKTVRESHGSVELSSLSLATAINERGIYFVKAHNQKKLSLETSLLLQIQEASEQKKRRLYNLEDLKELQNKLMLMSRRGEQNQTEVDYFAEVFDNVQRLARAFVDLNAAGNPLFRCWEAKIYCNTQSDPCIVMEFNVCKTTHHLKVRGKAGEQLPALCRKMESFLDDWQSFMDKQRSEHYYLNYFTAEQVVYLCSVLTQANVNAEIEDKALMMLSFIKPNLTASDVWKTLTRFHNKPDPGNKKTEDVQFQTLFEHQDHREGQGTADDRTDNEDQVVGLRELEQLWNVYMKNMGMFSPDSLDVRRLGGLLEMMTITERQEEDELEEPMLSETRDNSVRREFPKGLYSNQPNVIICPHDETLASSICLYMTSEYEPLPTYDEVLLCSPATPYEQVELFLRRCLTPGYLGRKIYTILWADQLSYDVSYAMEKSFQKLSSQTHDYKLVIYCSSEREHTYIPTAFSQFKRDFVPQEPLERVQRYLSRHYDSAASVFKGGKSVGIVSSRRAGVGKSLYVQRLYGKLERSVKQGSAFKKCIPLTESEIDDHKILLSLFNTPRDKDHKMFHFDVTSSVRKGLNEFLFKLLFLRYLMDSDGLMWRCTHTHTYIIEMLESQHEQHRHASRSVRKETFAFFEVFPKVLCRPPKEVMALEMNPDLESDDPLMDAECFRSEAYQRPYQYLTRFHKGENLDNFNYRGIEGTHEKYLQILLIYCGIIDPSWAELRNFTWFLNLQLQDCENSVFCKFEFVEDTLRGFKNFVVEFMILMSKDFATPSLCITDQSPGRQQIDLTRLNERDLAPFLIRKRWESEPHPYIFFNDDRNSMTFIGFHLQINAQNRVDAINPLTKEVIKKNIMTRELYNGLRHQGVPFNMDFEKLPRAKKIEHLCNVLGIRCSKDPDETYELTTDNILKMMAIHMRFRCGIPVIIMGETGCGKTKLIKFLCDFRRCGATTENMKLVKVHGGTTSEMIYTKVREAETLAKTNKEKHGFDSVLFLDEANTTEAISSIKEIICDNNVQGQQLDSQTGLQIIAACNPYRKHTDKMIERLEASGLGYRVRAEETEDRLGSIPLRQLVYRVQVLPPSMIPLVWDFGQLNDLTEQLYIEQIVQRQVDTNKIDKSYLRKITEVLSSSQKFMRKRKDECSFVSLRDVERCMKVFLWFYERHTMFDQALKAFLQKRYQRQKNRNRQVFSPADDRVIWSLLMAIGVCYQSCLETKGQYQASISDILHDEYTSQRIRQEIQLMQDLLLEGVPMGETIARNEALKENFFMMVICIEQRIPLFIVGKPGSSKSLSKTLVADAMQGLASHSELYKRLKQIHLVSFQCSPHSTPEGIINTFKQCARFQESKNLDEYISVVVLDEIGLAEDSPKMPLKTLHPLLEEGCIDDEPLAHKRVGFIGISNWALDPAKMNRGIFVSRGDPNQEELIKSAKGICSSDSNILETIKHLFKPFAKAYMEICKEGKGYFGLRDFYSLVKMVFSITKASKRSPTADEITKAVLRNFSGRDDVDVMSIFSQELKDDFTNHSMNTVDLVKQSLSPSSQADESRYLLILTKNYAALQILQQMFFSNQNHPEIIFGSSFPKDQEYTQICRNINRVKVCMETGQTVVLLNLQNLYESLYDALNQYYVTLGGQKYVDLGLGTHRVKCRVHKKFRLIVIEEKEVVYKQFPIPLINRLEKHYLDINTVLSLEQRDTVKQLQEWVNDFVSKQYTPSDVFIGYHSDTCSSVVLQVTEWLDTRADVPGVLAMAKHILLSCATPDSVFRLDNSRVFDEERESLVQEYFEQEMHRSLGDFIVSHTQQEEQHNFYFTEVTTFSRLLTAADTLQLQNMTQLDDIKLLSLHQFDTEYSFLKKIREFLGSTHADKVLIIQTDYDEDSHSGNILSSAKYSCINEVSKWPNDDNKATFVYFVTKLPRVEGGSSYIGFQGGPWKSVHIDDLRRSKEIASDVHSLKNLRISQLFEDPPKNMETDDADCEPHEREPHVMFDTTNLVVSCVQSAVSMLRDVEENGALSTRRVENLLTLLDGSEQQDAFVNVVRKRLHSLLEAHEEHIPYPKNWVLREASNISALQEGGTFTHTLWRKIQAVVIPLLANLVSVIDRDYNLDLLMDGEEDIRNLWLEIFTNNEMLAVPYVRVDSDSKVFKVQSHMTAGNTMRCAMPFSWWIKDFLDELLMQTLKQYHISGELEDLFWNCPLGRYMADKVNDKTKREFFQRYLQDFVSMTMKVTTDEELKILREALSSCINELQRRRNSEASPTLLHIHKAHLFYHSRLQNLSRMISLQPQVASHLLKTQRSKDCSEMVLDVHAAMACVECLELPPLDTDVQCQDWLRQVKRLQGPMELIYSQHKAKQYGERCKERLQNIRNGWQRIYTLSLCVEHMLLGLDADQRSLRDLVLKHIHTLGKVLGGNSDVKSEKAFQAVITVLRSCKQGVSEQIYRFGLQCQVCMTEPQDPVDLPCHHICCLACLTRCFDAGQKFCPMCRQVVPDNFDPKVSEDIRASIKQNSEFRRRCDGFFINLVSSVCFKDKTPPANGVIKHLLSYVRVETEQNQTHTKDLSPFDDSLDKNPVVRSVILKLLLNYSFDEVKGYLQQHLSSVEESRIMDEEDKTQLYALYINCLEDSMWERLPQEHNKPEELQPYLHEETNFLEHFLTTPCPQTVSIEHLQDIARVRLSLTMATQLINPMLPDESVPEGTEAFLNAVANLCEHSRNDWYRIYLIRKLSSQRGVELVQRMVKEETFRWLFPAEIYEQNEDAGQMDQYLVYGEEYKLVRDAVAKAMLDCNVEEIEEVCQKCTAPPRERTIYLLLALFREVTALYRSSNTGLHPTPEQCQALGELTQGSTFLHRRELRALAEALVHNRLGSLSVCSDHSVLENTQMELTVHLAAVLLTGTHDCLQPLQGLGLTPQHMLNAFIPTMPDDMLVVVQNLLKQNSERATWYVCLNNHPCFVGECGLPTEGGRCLECGAEVGGEKHVAVSGFKRIEQQQQGDRTRRGHILGDPQRRDHPDTLDTKTMPLSPFTLVRMVTHLALLLGASEQAQFVGQIVQPPVQDVCLFLKHHLQKDMEQLSRALGRGVDHTVTAAHLILRALLEPTPTNPGSGGSDPNLSTKESRNAWETAVAVDIMTPQLKDLDKHLREFSATVRKDFRVASNLIMKVTFEDECSFLSCLPRGSQVHSSVVWSSRQRLSLLSLTNILEQNNQKETLPLLWRFLQKETEFRQVKFLPDILTFQRHLVKKIQNASDQIHGSIREFLERQTGQMRKWYEKHVHIFLSTWNLLRLSVTSNEMKLPEEYCSEDLTLDSVLQYLLPRRQGPGLCATALLSYLVSLHNELVYAVDSHTGEDSSSYKVSLADLTEQHVICYEVEKDLLPLLLSNCQYSLEAGQETVSQYDLPKIQHHILTGFLQGKPLITRTDVPTLVSSHERNYKTLFKVVKGKVLQEGLSSLTRNALSRELDSYSEVCEALKVLELVLGFLSMTGGSPTMPLVDYLKDMLKMADQTDPKILKALRGCRLRHCVSLWQLLSSLKSENTLRLKREPFSGHSSEYQEPLTEEQELQLKGFMSKGNVDKWLCEMHEFLLLGLGCLHATDTYNPSWSVKEALGLYMDSKEVQLPVEVETSFPDQILLSQIVEMWKYAVTTKPEWMM
ncbi:E3 ubiquitin-protein ligase rnf213-alpha-like [Polymixia lowei]